MPQSSAPVASAPGADARIRVMVVDDSVFVRGIVSRWLSEDPAFELVGTFSNGKAALADLDRVQPDVVILDLEMPEMDGLTALPLILKQRRNTTVIVASALSRRGAEVSLKALTLGAADYLPKPDATKGTFATDDFKRELMEKVRSLGLKVLRQAGRAPALPPPSTQPQAAALPSQPRGPIRLRPYSVSDVSLIAVGSSTGGPQALTRLFAVLGPYIDRIPVVITQHMPPTFTALLAEHVTRAAGRQAAEGQDGEALRAGRIYIAPGGKHMLLERDGARTVIRLSDGPAVNFCKPAVDPMFDTVAQIYRRNALALVLTGMGSDGARGAGIIADAGGSVIVQDEETSVVWGMPGATASAGNASEVLPLQAIGPKVIAMLARRRG